MKKMIVKTTARVQMVNITNKIREMMVQYDWRNGIVTLFCPHTTAAVTTTVLDDKTVHRDFMVKMEQLVPYADGYTHECNPDAHIKSAVMGPSLQLIIENQTLQLGQWQGVFFCEFDGPRERELWIRWSS